MRPMIGLFAILVALALSGCGGHREDMAAMAAGSGAGAESGPPDWLLDAGTASGNVAGSNAYAMTSDELSALDERIVTSADTWILGGVYRSPGEFPGYAWGAACTGGACRYGASGEGDLDGFFFDAEYQPVMERGGIRLGQAFYDATSNPDAPQELTGYGAWMHYNTFLVQISFHPDKGAPDSVQAAPYSVGRASGTNPVSGSASWTGVAVGTDLNRLFPIPDMLQGDAGIVYDFGDSSVDVTLDNFVNLRTGAAADHRMAWTGIAVNDGAFSKGTHWDGEHVAGTFYGGYHEEAGGVFRSGSIVGSFGASRSDRQ